MKKMFLIALAASVLSTTAHAEKFSCNLHITGLDAAIGNDRAEKLDVAAALQKKGYTLIEETELREDDYIS